MKKLALCMIVKNEEKRLEKALENSSIYADEIVIVDTGSTDKTKEVASRFTDKIFDFVWQDDFSKARNYAFKQATCQYLMWLDGDDIVPLETAKAILRWKEQDDGDDVVMCPYIADYKDDFTPTFSYLRERIVNGDKGFCFHEPVHEAITPSGKITTQPDIKIYHGKYKKERSGRNLAIYKKMLANGQPFSPRSQYYYARELFYNNFIDEAIHEFSKFLADGRGWKENNIDACIMLAKCYRIKKEKSKALTVLFGSFVYDNPRCETLYEIGQVYFHSEEYSKAVYWYNLALQGDETIKSGAFINSEVSTILPALQLCVCYDKLGKIDIARHYHEIAKAYAPDDKSVIANEAYFNNLG